MKLLMTKKAVKELDKIPDPIAKNISNKIIKLSSNPCPPNSKKLHGQNEYRLRIGSFRVLYWIDKSNKTITISRVADRKTVYR